MVKHIVLWKIKDDENKQQNIDTMITMLMALVGKIDGLVGIEMGYNFDVSSDYDVVLYATFKNAVALKYYQNHPEHIKCKEFIGKISVGRTAADYFWEEEISAQRPFDETPDAPESPKAEPKTKTEPKAEPKPSLFKKKDTTPPPPPMAENENTWTCPNCGKVMPNYVGTCGCGEPKPFEFEFTPNANTTATPVEPVAPTKPEPPKAEPKPVVDTASYNPAEKISRKPVFSTPTDNTQSDSWTCPKCGKVLPNYVGTCGCGESKPFGDFENEPAEPTFSIGNIPINSSDRKSGLPDIQKISEDNSEDTYDTEELSNIEPSLPSYNAQLETPNTPEQDFGQDFSFIKNDSAKTEEPDTSADTTAPDLSFIKPSDSNFSNSNYEQPVYPNAVQSDEQPIYPNAVQANEQPIYPNATTDTEPSNDALNNSADFGTETETEDNPEDDVPFFNFDNVPPPAPMRYTDEPPASLHLNIDSPKPMNYKDIKAADYTSPSKAPAQKSAPKPEPKVESTPATKPFSHLGKTENPPQPKPEKKHLFGKKAKDADALQKAEAAVNARKDVPNDGTWTCPNCGKVMPKYVGTCGCGEQQPFDF